MFCTVVGLSISNGEGSWDRINESLEGIRKTCLGCCWKTANTTTTTTPTANMYSSLPTHDTYSSHNHYHDTNARKEEEPIYTFGTHRQAFKPNFYSSSWGREYLNAKVEREFDQIDKNGMVKSADGTTQYIRFDEMPEPMAGGAHHYANIFVSPYFTKEGAPITTFSTWTKTDSIGVCLFIYNLIQFIYQLMMYRSIVAGCTEIANNDDNAERLMTNERLLRWMC